MPIPPQKALACRRFGEGRGCGDMLTREQILKTIDAAYTRRRQGDKSVTADLMAPGGTYALAGDASLLVGYPVGPSEAVAAVSKLIDLFTFHDDERLEAAVERLSSDRSLARNPARAARTARVVATEIAQFWTFNDDGKALSLLEFADTALIAQLLKGLRRGEGHSRRKPRRPSSLTHRSHGHRSPRRPFGRGAIDPEIPVLAIKLLRRNWVAQSAPALTQLELTSLTRTPRRCWRSGRRP